MALVPDVAKSLIAKDVAVTVEAGAGEGSGHPDAQY